MAALFDHYVIVDWSAANQPKQGRDSIWICHRGPQGERCDNPPTRMAARAILSKILAAITAAGERVVAGFDFPFGYPAGFASRLGLQGPPWRAVWDEIAALIEDGDENRNNRFEVAALLNRRASSKPFPFWGCPAGKAGEFLGMRHHRAHGEAEPLRERRLIDERMVGAQPCWKLAYTGSVGSQALTGIPIVRALRDDPRWAERVRIWPFETGLRAPADAPIVFAEVWPSWWRREIRPDCGPPHDKAQVRSVASIFAAADAAGELRDWFAGDPGLTKPQRDLIETEEAWTLGVREKRSRGPVSARTGRRLDPPPPSAGLIDPPPQAGEGRVGAKPRLRASYAYLRDPAAIYRRSFALIRAETDLSRFPPSLRPVALRLAHAAGDVGMLDDLAWSRGAATAGKHALVAGAAIIVDSRMVAAGISAARLPAANPIICTLADPSVPALARAAMTTRSAAAVELWLPHLAGAVVAIGNAPTALFRLLELLAAGAGRPALVLGFPVGFVGAAEAKAALIGFGGGLSYIALKGRRGGSALAAAAVNALCSPPRRPAS